MRARPSSVHLRDAASDALVLMWWSVHHIQAEAHLLRARYLLEFQKARQALNPAIANAPYQAVAPFVNDIAHLTTHKRSQIKSRHNQQSL